MSLPALTRGLTLLEELIKKPSGMRYSDLKGTLHGVGDASLNRLLSSLIESGHIIRADGCYAPSERVLTWFLYVKDEGNFDDEIKNLVENLAKRTGESAGFCLYKEKRLIIQHSVSFPDSINIIGPGQTLHYEADHAASLAVMDLMLPEEREEAIKSAYSRTSHDEWLKGREQFFRNSYYADLSRLREGTSRLALSWRQAEKRGSLFLCLPTVRLKRREEGLIQIMTEELSRLSDFPFHRTLQD